jgi:hypothetical protein
MPSRIALAVRKHSPMFGEDVARFRESCVGGWHWIDFTDTINRIRGLHPLSRFSNPMLGVFLGLLSDH